MVCYYISIFSERFILKIIPLIKRVLSRACIYYTAATLILYSAGMLLSNMERQWIPTLSMMFTVFFFSVLFSLVNQLVWNTRLPGILKLLIHYTATTLIFYVMFILWGNYSAAPSAVLIILMAYTLVYAAFSLFIFLIRYIFSFRKNSKTTYKSQFKNDK